jgi:hypothetical protein
MANGLDEDAARSPMPHGVRALDGQHGIRLLAGIECDIRPDGTMDLAMTVWPLSTSSSPPCIPRSTRIGSR